MNFEAEKIRKIYSGKTARHYDLPISHMFKKYKKLAFKDSAIKQGDKILVFCCGTGLDFPHILDRIGNEGRIVGVDFSTEMLNEARKKIRRKGWHNVELIETDVTRYKNSISDLFDAGVCTLGLSIIPDFKTAFTNLLANVKTGGEIIIGDMQLAPDGYARFNPFTLLLAGKYGGTYEGHRNSLELYSMMSQELKNLTKKEFFLKSYYYCIGKK